MIPFWKGVYSKGKNLNSSGSKYFSFSVGSLPEKQIDSYKICRPCKNDGEFTICIYIYILLKYMYASEKATHD